MIRQCFLTNTGILFHREMFKHIGMDPDMLYPVVKPRPPPIELKSHEGSHDASHRPSHRSTDKTPVNHESIGPAFVTDFENEEHEDVVDALCPIYDQLKLRPAWWVLEVVPRKLHFQRSDNSWARVIKCVCEPRVGRCFLRSLTRGTSVNFGRGRPVPGQKRVGVKVHRTVKTRMDADGLEGGRYRPKAKLEVEPIWVD
jgi:hypothetical protein